MSVLSFVCFFLVYVVLSSPYNSHAYGPLEAVVNALSDEDVHDILDVALPSARMYKEFIRYLRWKPSEEACNCDWFHDELPGSTLDGWQYQGNAIDVSSQDISLYWNMMNIFSSFTEDSCDLSSLPPPTVINIINALNLGHQFLARLECASVVDFDEEWTEYVLPSLGIDSLEELVARFNDALVQTSDNLCSSSLEQSNIVLKKPNPNPPGELWSGPEENDSPDNTELDTTTPPPSFSPTISSLDDPVSFLTSHMDLTQLSSDIAKIVQRENAMQYTDETIEQDAQEFESIAVSLSYNIRSCAQSFESDMCITNGLGVVLQPFARNSTPSIFQLSTFDILQGTLRKNISTDLVLDFGLWRSADAIEELSNNANIYEMRGRKQKWNTIRPKKVTKARDYKLIGAIFSAVVDASDCFHATFSNNNVEYNVLDFATIATQLTAEDNIMNGAPPRKIKRSVKEGLIVLGIVLGVIILFACIFCLYLWRRRRAAQSPVKFENNYDSQPLLTNTIPMNGYLS